MIASVWDRLWVMHDDTKAMFAFTPKAMKRLLTRKGTMFSVRDTEHDVDLAEEMEEAPAEHTRRVQSGPGGVDEGEPREYTTRQKVGLLLGPLLFVLMLLANCLMDLGNLETWSVR